MSDIRQVLAQEGAAAEAQPDAPTTTATVVTRGPQKARVYSVRLTEGDVARLEAAAQQAGVTPSALARDCIVTRLNELDSGAVTLASVAADLEAVSHRLAALSHQRA
jgi:hypothetical protein